MPEITEIHLQEFFSRAIECWRETRPSAELPALRVTFGARVRLAKEENSKYWVLDDLRRSCGPNSVALMR